MDDNGEERSARGQAIEYELEGGVKRLGLIVDTNRDQAVIYPITSVVRMSAGSLGAPLLTPSPP